MIRRIVACAVLTAAVLAPTAIATPSLSLKHGKVKITAVFRQELTDAVAIAVSSHVGPCSRHGQLTVICFTAATMVNNGQRIRCSKYYRARLVRGRISVTESANGAHWLRFAHSRCVTAA